MRYALTDIITDIVGHPLPERSENAMVRCPLHQDRRPSLSVNLNSGLWVCFSCGDKGGAAKLARIFEAPLDESELVLREVRASSSPYFDEPMDFSLLAHELHGRALREQPRELVEYVVRKGLHHGVVKHFRLGWDGLRIAMPYYDDGRVVGIKYRHSDGRKEAERGSKRHVYNIDEIRGKPVVIVCEGESDTHAVWGELKRLRAGDEIAVCGIPGASVTRSQWELWALDLMWARTVYVAWDADEAGDRGATQAMDVLGEKAVRARPSMAKDINDHLLKGGRLEQAGIRTEDIRPLA